MRHMRNLFTNTQLAGEVRTYHQVERAGPGRSNNSNKKTTTIRVMVEYERLAIVSGAGSFHRSQQIMIRTEGHRTNHRHNS